MATEMTRSTKSAHRRRNPNDGSKQAGQPRQPHTLTRAEDGRNPEEASTDAAPLLSPPSLSRGGAMDRRGVSEPRNTQPHDIRMTSA